MEIFLNLMIFIMGTFFGSFFTLAVYRIPLKKDITHEHSFCPNCNHKLGVLDLVPVWSYLFLRGKCRYCGEKVRIRYLLLEVLSGFVFLITYKSLNIQNIFINLDKVIIFISFVFLYVTTVLVAGIDKEYRKINTSVLLFGCICQCLYILYLYIVEQANIYRYSIYFAIFIFLFVTNILVQKKKEAYFLQILLLLSYVLFVVGIKTILPIVLCSLFVILILYFIKKDTKLPIGFAVCLSTIVYQIVENFIKFY